MDPVQLDTVSTGLLEEVGGGDIGAMGRLFDLISGSIRRDLELRIAGLQARESATLDAFVAIWTHAPRFRSSGQPASEWIAGILGAVLERHAGPARRAVPGRAGPIASASVS